jgi:Fe-S cluster assembly protein SufD
LPSATLSPVDALGATLDGFDGTLLSHAQRRAALERFAALHSGREHPGRYWRIDLETLAPDAATVTPSALAGRITIEGAPPAAIACGLDVAAAQHPQFVARVLGATVAAQSKFGALATAFFQHGTLIVVPAGVAVDDPIVITYDAPSDAASFPATFVLLERGARATIIERVRGGNGSFVVPLTEIVAEENADVTYAIVQDLPANARIISTRAARPGRNARVTWADAELGGALAVADLTVTLDAPGADAAISAIFFPSETQHVDLVSTVDHRVGDTTSQTIVKTAATGRGQARYLGNIWIEKDAQGSDASLRDDALLLSKDAHIDSVPALEIAANDVKAYHGATVGALDDDQIFYMESRGIERGAAERMIALGFFSPAVDRFPTESLREHLRTLLEAKLG